MHLIEDLSATELTVAEIMEQTDRMSKFQDKMVFSGDLLELRDEKIK